jgi:predicted metalloprotease with PDZ domain
MRLSLPGRLAIAALLLAAPAPAAAEPVVSYRFSFPEPEHRWMLVEAIFTELPVDTALDVRMSRASPGRYALHDFAKNVYDVDARSGGGQPVEIVREDPHGWRVTGHDGTVRFRYKVYGDSVDGTYLAVDPTHAHINMPAVIVWGRGLEERPARVTFEQPEGRQWQVVTQLFPGEHPLEFAAPNLQYLLDSPVEFGPGTLRTFRVEDRLFRVLVHHTGSDEEVDRFVRAVEQIVREQGEIFGEYPAYEPGHFTFLADYVPWASYDGMEHRNSTVMTSPSPLSTARVALLDTASHEFFHGWNVERIRPRTLEPFDFERGNMSGELWLAEGFTQYYGPLVLSRAGLADLEYVTGAMSTLVGAALDPARSVRSPVEMSRMAPFTDGRHTADRTNWPITVISYYSQGGAIALALDLTLRERSQGRVTLDDYMRALWRAHGRSASRPGYVDQPYTLADAETRLAEVSGDAGFARDFFARHVHGHDAADYERLLRLAGLVMRRPAAGRAWLGEVRFDDRAGSVRLASAPHIGSPLYDAGLDVDDVVRELDGEAMRSFGDLARVLGRRRPGDRIPIVFVNRTGVPQRGSVTLGDDPAFEIVPAESLGALTPAQRAFRESWLH